jgi:peptidoglycan/LPS O-acetylase OafA/YrhL
MTNQRNIASFRMPAAGVALPALDGLRGIAVILVMLHHFALYGTKPATLFVDKSLNALLLSGWIGVDLFFVLSGFLITGILIDSKGGARYLRTFYARRFLRIFPLYYGFLFAFLVLIPFLHPIGSGFTTLLAEQGWYWTYLINWKIGLTGWPEYYPLGHFWTLAVEEQFYVFWPLVVFFSGRKTLLRICCSLLLVCLAIRSSLILMNLNIGAYVLTPARADALAVGALLAVALRSEAGKALLSRWTRPVLLCSGLALAVLFVAQRQLNSEAASVLTVGLSALGLFFGAVLILVITSPANHLLGKVCTTPALRFFGRYSYALYVFHHPVALYLHKRMVVSDWFPARFLPGLLLFSVTATALSVSLALLSWHLLESPFLRLKRFFRYTLPPRKNLLPVLQLDAIQAESGLFGYARGQLPGVAQHRASRAGSGPERRNDRHARHRSSPPGARSRKAN